MGALCAATHSPRGPCCNSEPRYINVKLKQTYPVLVKVRDSVVILNMKIALGDKRYGRLSPTLVIKSQESLVRIKTDQCNKPIERCNVLTVQL